MDELLSEFLTETNESLSTLDNEVVNLERNPDNPGLVDNIFRLVHTIKGTCGFLGLPRLEAVAHASENLLGKIRDGELAVDAQGVSLILASLDRIKGILNALEATESEPEGEDGELIRALDAMADDAQKPAPVELASPELESEKVRDPGPERALKSGEVSLDELERVFQETAGPESAAPEAPSIEAPDEVVEALRAEALESPMSGGDSAVANQSIRVTVDLLENLMTMVSELVLTRNQLLQMVRAHTDSAFKVPLQRLSHVTTELQEGVMKTRMQPIGNAWAKLPRIIRDLSHELDKKIDLEMLGSDTELDRQVLELIRDPLTHMVRNSADHGLESRADRLAAGKPETGRIVLNAFHEGGHIIIEISDDGRGLDVDKLTAVAIEKELATPAECEAMTDQQVMQFIFKPGFSTAQAVTSVSGRGVGMDVVRTNIEKIGGTIDLRSEFGKGTSLTIKIPLTLAIVSALIVECRGERFAIPQISVIELVQASGHSENQIETINETPVLRLRNRLLPLVYLGDRLRLARDGEEIGDENEELYVVVTQVGAYTFGIVVDQVFDTEEIVV
ncbi:MAG: chemotaxis protein CheA, partial [Myxococcota bacterium]